MGRRDKGTRAAAGEKSGAMKSLPLAVSVMLASMEVRSRRKPPPKEPASTSYMDGIDLPPSYDEVEAADAAAAAAKEKSAKRATVNLSAVVLSQRDAKKKEMREQEAAAQAAAARREALRNDCSEFSVVIGAQVPASEGDAAAADKVRDVILSEKFSVSLRGRALKLFDKASLSVSHGQRYGLVGPNGKGKSTLLKLLACRKLPVPERIDVLLVEQEVAADGRSVAEVVVAADEKLVALRDERDRLEAANNDEDNKRLAEVYEQLNFHGSDAARSHASKILAGLGFDQAMQARATKSFSGGWRMRVSLARALFMQPTLLLLDEPTNHLDLRSVLWLEEYLSTAWNKTLIVVSDDRDFLNTVCNNVIHLHDQKLDLYPGDFDYFVYSFDQKRTKAIREHKEYVKLQRAAKAEQDKLSKAAKAKGDDHKTAQDKLPKADKVRKEEKNAGQQPVAAPQRWQDYRVKFHFKKPIRLRRRFQQLLQLTDAGFSYPDRPDFKLSGVNADIDMGTRVTIVGPNGGGKSTLLKLLSGELEPTEGEVKRSYELRTAHYCQHLVDVLTMEENAVEYLLRTHAEEEEVCRPCRPEAVSRKLVRFGLREKNHLVPIAKLSGGEKARVVFTSIAMERPHVLLLDEPTKHLDMESIDALADALYQYAGGVVLVSHDSRLISRLCEEETRSQVWVVEDGAVTTYDGTFEAYKNNLLREIKAEVAETQMYTAPSQLCIGISL